METFVGDIPFGWETTTPDLVTEQTSQGLVHSGNSAVNLLDGAVLTQIVEDITGGCYYEFSFFALAQGVNVGLTVTVTFETTTGDVTGAVITVRDIDSPNIIRNYGYYKVITIAAPENVIDARITFEVIAVESQSINIDDVSLSAN